MAQLTDSQRTRCRLVAAISTANHFSVERRKLDAQLAGCAPSLPQEKLFWKMYEAFQALIAEIAAAGGLCRDAYKGEDRALIETLGYFELFHRFLPDFDAHIVKQRATPDKSLPLSCGHEMVELMRDRGLEDEEIARHVGFFFQLRRAYFFIGEQLKGSSASMVRLREQLWNNVFTADLHLYRDQLMGNMEQYATLILGPTGTGKGAAAAAIGKSGYIPYDIKTNRFAESFEASFTGINLSQFSENLLESELFGHRKGAFTGAMEGHEGLLDRCSATGSVLLDEIGDIALSVQIKLLKVIQERWFSPVGSHEMRPFRGRIIAATHRDIGELRAAGSFRDDFYYRLCSDTIVIPSLAQRIAEESSELPTLVTHLTERIIGAEAPAVVARVLTALEELGSYDWPGNVRELEQAIRSVIIGGSYRGDHRSGLDPVVQMVDKLPEPLSFEQLMARYSRELYTRIGTYDGVGRVMGVDRRTVRKYMGEG